MDIIALIDTYVRGLLHAEEKFLCHLDALPELEQTVSRLSNQMAAGFIGLVLSNADRLIRESGIRKENYTVQRERRRTLISSVGDITFTHTLYKRSDGRTCCLLDDLIRLPDRERFTTVAEAKLLNEAEVHSYQHAAESIETNGETVTKATVMNKVHAIVDEIPEMEDATPEKKQCEYLYIEADEDHIHGQKDGREQGISKRGRSKLRAVLFNAAIPLVAKNPEFKSLHEYYTTRANNPLKKKQSVIAISCKLIRVFYAILAKGVTYDPQKMLSDIHRQPQAA